MDELLLFIDRHAGFISFCIFVWFGYDCKIQKRIINDSVEWCLYFIFSVFMVRYFSIAGLGTLI